MNPHEKALNGIFDDLDNMESKKMFGQKEPGEDKGVSITITVSPNGASEEGPGESEEQTDSLAKGGYPMADGGLVQPESEDLSLPPFLRKKKSK